jgi:hypothetical protein
MTLFELPLKKYSHPSSFGFKQETCCFAEFETMGGGRVKERDDELFERIKETFYLPVDEAAARLGTNCCTQAPTTHIHDCGYCDHI